MRTIAKSVGGSILLVVLLSAPGHGGQGNDQARVDLLGMKSVPEGHYLVNLEAGGSPRFLNIQVKGESARCVNTSDPRMAGFEGKFELIGNGVFRVTFKNKDFTASQWWVFRADGSAAVKEVPDRGEKQSAVPVADDSLNRPKGSQ